MALDEGLHDLLGGTRQPTSFIVVEILLVVCRAMQSIEIREMRQRYHAGFPEHQLTIVYKAFGGEEIFEIPGAHQFRVVM
jgi:hypothetical protein